MNRRPGLLLAAAALVVAAGCTSPQLRADSGPTRDLRVGLLEYEVITSHVAVMPGVVKLKITNAGAEAHDLYIDGAETLAASPVIPPGESTTLKVWAPDDQVELVLWCTLPGHRSQGMLTRLAVTSDRSDS